MTIKKLNRVQRARIEKMDDDRCTGIENDLIGYRSLLGAQGNEYREGMGGMG
jgi:hypothetical protein